MGKYDELLVRLGKEVSHYVCEDCWYSCPKCAEGCCNDGAGDECTCGADAENALRRDAAARILVLEADAKRYRARRYTIYKDRLRIEMPQGKNWRPTTFEDFCAEYDAACDKEIEKQAAERSKP